MDEDDGDEGMDEYYEYYDEDEDEGMGDEYYEGL